MSLGDIANTLSNTVSSFSNAFSNSRLGGPSAHFEGITNKVYAQNWKLSLPYSFQVIGVNSPLDGGSTPLSGLTNIFGQAPGGGLFDEFVLPFNPQDITQDENFSIVVTPTQRGIVVEHNSIVLRDLIISGTTGMRPTAFQTGYEVFQNLRNYFRSYAQLKKDPSQKNTKLLFINRKDNERLIVEPVKFTMKRSAGRPFLYDYVIVLKVLGMQGPLLATGLLGEFFNKIDTVLTKAYTYINQARNVFITSLNTLKIVKTDFESAVLAPFQLMNLTIKSFQGLSYTLADVPDTLRNDWSIKTIASFLDAAKFKKNSGDKDFVAIKIPNNTIKEATNFGYQSLNVIPFELQDKLGLIGMNVNETRAFNNLVSQATSQTRLFYSELQKTIDDVRDDFSDFASMGSNYYNQFVGRESFGILSAGLLEDEKFAIMNAFIKADLAINMMLSNDGIFRNTIQNEISVVEEAFNNQMDIPNPGSVNEIFLPDNKTLEDLASEFLGTGERWIEIAILNELEAPYIDANSTNPKVKRPGEKILIPSSKIAETSNIPDSKIIPINQNLSTTEKNLGVDIKVTKDFDFSFAGNELNLVAGGENAGQAIILKLYLEKGSLKYHPNIGIGLQIGEKTKTGPDIRDDITSTILSDPRFTGIKNLTFLADGSSVAIGLDLIVRYLATPVPLRINV